MFPYTGWFNFAFFPADFKSGVSYTLHMGQLCPACFLIMEAFKHPYADIFLMPIFLQN